ncbi:MAG TPA: DeoR/GlpR family DNA-binding transcription regulator [Symbiobacteriaceae bacterium]|nr:DeoR/GlpR family DNA-binding transcription regulator [Symbiobacteriaceae bacterium]
MLPIERRQRIMDLLQAEGVVAGAELAERFGVNVATIRRDLKYLAEHYGVQVTYGGASLGADNATPVQVELNLREKEVTDLEAKRFIAQKAAALVRDGESIALNAGSTVRLILDYLPADFTNLTVVTLGLNIASAAVALPYVHLFMPGGHYRAASQALVGPTAERALGEIHVDRAFLGASAVDMNAGWTHPAYAEAATNQLLMKIAKKRYLVCGSRKFDRVAFARVCNLAEFDAFIVDNQFPPHYAEWAKANDVEII